MAVQIETRSAHEIQKNRITDLDFEYGINLPSKRIDTPFADALIFAVRRPKACSNPMPGGQKGASKPVSGEGTRAC
jgi:hypothetical protein